MARNLKWFKTGFQFDAKFTGFKVNLKTKVANRCWQRMTVFAEDRVEAINEVKKQAAQYGYQNVTIDHITRIG